MCVRPVWCGALMVAAGLHGDARTGSISHWRALKRCDLPLVCPISTRRPFALAPSSVFHASPATPTSALSCQTTPNSGKPLFSLPIDSRAQPPLVSQAETEARNNSFFVATARTVGAILFVIVASQGSSAPSRNAHRITAIAPATGSRLRSRCPIFEIPAELRLLRQYSRST